MEEAASADEFVHGLFAFLEQLAEREPAHPVLAGLVEDLGRRGAEAEAAGWLHDLSNALQVTDGQLYVMNQTLRGLGSRGDSPADRADLLLRLLEALGAARQATHEASKIARSTIPYYRRNVAPANVAEVLKASFEVCRHIVPTGAELLLEEVVDATVAAPRTDVLRVVTNLVRNALEVVDGQLGGIVVISAWRTEENAFIRVSDNGPGVDPAHLDQIFELFFTTKKEGSGVGLYVCKQLVEGWGGGIQVESARGEGTRFTFHVPIGEVG
jgi:signal transduction histidine kinase